MAEYDIGEAFRRIEDELISSMQRNLSHHINLEEEEGISYTMWQVEQLAALQRYQQENAKEFPKRFEEINTELETVLRDMHEAGGFEQEEEILNAIKKGFVPRSDGETMQATFFGKNSRKLAALINSTRNDMERAETAVLRLVNDQYRKIIYNAQVYYNTGAGTLSQCVDMASHDFLAAGINCVEYKNGARVGIDSYAEMALRTASTRAYLQGEAEMRDGWGINTVKVMARGNACHKCMQWVGRVYYDDVWSEVPPPPAEKRKYPLLSEAIEGGLYHPNCKDTHSTYFEGLEDEPQKPTQKDADKAAETYNAEQKKRYARRQARKYERL
ncbi:MAG: minor capsid protein, partial [Clostridiales bacterium]|nr:minor capsid protein [Candidatus Cacconaster stercorequi]